MTGSIAVGKRDSWTRIKLRRPERQRHERNVEKAHATSRLPLASLDAELRCGGVEVKLLNVVKNVYRGRASLDECRRGQLGRLRASADVSFDGDHRRHLA